MEQLEGERVIVRPLQLADAPAMLSLYQRNAAYLAPWDPVRPTDFYTLAYQEREIRAGLEAEASDRGYTFGITTRAEGRLIGRLRLSGVTRGAFQSAYLGYWLDQGHAGRGLMTEAVRLAVGAALTGLALHRVQAATLPNNLASIAVLTRNGFRREGLALRYLLIAGRWQDHVLFAMTAEEWPPRPPAVGKE